MCILNNLSVNEKVIYILYKCIFQINETRLIDGRGGFHGRGRFSNTCDYLITIKTSCDSPTHTKDEISLLFGDAYGAEVLFFHFSFFLFLNYYFFMH
jgi:hypothetical protein